MAKNPDHLKKWIKEALLPVAGEDGFGLYRPKELVRVKGPFLDQIGFQLSQYGSKLFYVHYSKKLVSYPFLNIGSYSVGERLSDNSKNEDTTKWRGVDDKDSQEAIASVVRAYQDTIRPWFDSLESIPSYIFEYLAKNRNTSTQSLEFAVAFAEAGKPGRAWWICSDILEQDTATDAEILAACQQYLDSDEAEKLNEIFTNEQYAECRSAFAEVEVPVTDHNSIDSLLAYWREKNLEKYKLKKYVV